MNRVISKSDTEKSKVGYTVIVQQQTSKLILILTTPLIDLFVIYYWNTDVSRRVIIYIETFLINDLQLMDNIVPMTFK